MPFEIDMLPVGNADAFLIRYFNELNDEIVILIDAGRKQHGQQVVDHINKYTNKKSIDLAICTHPDADHIGGFFAIVDQLNIGEFWIHDPVKHKADIKKILESIHQNKLEKGLSFVVETLDDSINLLTLIDKKGIRRDREPFAGLSYEKAPIFIVGPTLDYYEKCLSQFRDIKKLFEEEKIAKGMEDNSIIGQLAAKEIFNDKNDHSKSNNSSVITYFNPEDKKCGYSAA